MAYKIAYLEDLDARSIKRNIEQQGFEVTHITPQDNFEDTLSQIQQIEADLLLMDFRLHAGVAQFNAPPFAQFFRSQVVENGINLPIVLISSEDNISDYYRDYTSFDLFDFAVVKKKFLAETHKYCTLFNELINAYQYLKQAQSKKIEIGLDLLNIPDLLQMRVDSRLLDTLSMYKYQSDPFMMSGLLLSTFVKPIGILIGSDVLAARLGISKKSKDWGELLDHLNEFKYSGIYSKTYQRWWSQGLEIWWKSSFPDAPTLRRLPANERHKLISDRYKLKDLIPLEKLEYSNSTRFWTICAGNFLPLDPIDGFELVRDIDSSPWLEPKFYSLAFLIDHMNSQIKKELKDLERARFSEKVRDL